MHILLIAGSGLKRLSQNPVHIGVGIGIGIEKDWCLPVVTPIKADSDSDTEPERAGF
jgi:hypothetical protein